MVRMVCAAAVALAAFGCSRVETAKEVALVENGLPKCRIVVADDASRPEKFGAQELAKYLLKKGTGNRDRGSGERIPVRVSVDGGLVKSGELLQRRLLRARDVHQHEVHARIGRPLLKIRRINAI